MDDTRPKQFIRHGIQAHTDAGAIGGVDTFFDEDSRPTALLAATPEGGTSTRVELHEGDSFELGSELWQVTEISSPNTDFWYVVLTQVR